MILQNMTYDKGMWRVFVICILFLSLSFSFIACSDLQRSEYDPLSSEYIYAYIYAPTATEVDLGLSVNWASWNIGATSPEKYGAYFAWGETRSRKRFDLEDYIYADKYIPYHISSTTYDVAHMKWGNGWRMPTKEDFEELISMCTIERTYVKGVYGCKFIGPNGKSIFLPAAGRQSGTICQDDDEGYYWSETRTGSDPYCLNFWGSSSISTTSNYDGYQGLTVRPVKNKVHKERTIYEIYESGGGYSITKGVVIATSKQEVIIDDVRENYIPIQMREGHSLVNGDSIIVEGIVRDIDGVLKFEQNCSTKVLGNDNLVTWYYPTVLDETGMKSYVDNPLTMSVRCTGTLEYEQGRYYVAPYDDDAIRWYISNPNDEAISSYFIGKDVVVYGYATGIYGNSINTVAKLITFVEEDYWTGNVKITMNGNEFNMILVEAGSFMMGATDEQQEYASSREYPVHLVTLSDYYIADTEFTIGLYAALEEDYRISNRYPRSFSYNYAYTIIDILSYSTGFPFRFPAEAQWEFAARGGNQSEGYIYSGSNILDEVGWHNEHSAITDTVKHEVALLKPNELGIYDMSGNLGEWCSDWYGDYTEDATTNPAGPESGTGKVMRGGDYYNKGYWCRVSSRYDKDDFNTSYDNFGLRLCIDFSSTRTRSSHSNVTNRNLESHAMSDDSFAVPPSVLPTP